MIELTYDGGRNVTYRDIKGGLKGKVFGKGGLYINTFTFSSIDLSAC